MASTNSSSRSIHKVSPVRVVVKALSLLLLFNFIFPFIDPLPWISQLSIYNSLVPGRERLPYGEQPEKSYNLNLYQLEAMFKSHKIDGAKKSANEFRLILIGDSSTWGFLLTPQETLASSINAKNSFIPDGKHIIAYNLGYPVMSLTKDLLILNRAMRYQPDMIIWLVTLESFPYDKQLFPPLLQHNRDEVFELLRTNNLNMERYIENLKPLTFWDRTLIGSRRNLADVFRLQLMGMMWAATGIDQYIPDTIEQPMQDLPADLSFHNLTPPHLSEDVLAFDVLQAGFNISGDVPLVIVNEPMFISHGNNSDVRYNYYYPRWAYDDYRQLLSSYSEKYQWNYIDLWNSIDAPYFSNTAVHLTPEGVNQLADLLMGQLPTFGQH